MGLFTDCIGVMGIFPDDVVVVLSRAGLDVGAIPADVHRPEFLLTLALAEGILFAVEVLYHFHRSFVTSPSPKMGIASPR